MRRFISVLVLLASVSCASDSTAPLPTEAGLDLVGTWDMVSTVRLQGTISLHDSNTVSTNPDTIEKWRTLGDYIVVDDVASGTATLQSNGVTWPATACSAMRYRTWAYPQFRDYPGTATVADTSYSVTVQCNAKTPAADGYTYRFSATTSLAAPLPETAAFISMGADYVNSAGLIDTTSATCPNGCGSRFAGTTVSLILAWRPTSQ